MTRNQETIDLLQAKVREATSSDSCIRNIERFELKDVQIDSSMSIANKMFSEDAMKRILDVLNVKPAFKDFQKSMSEKDWEMVADRIKKAKGETFLYGDISNDGKVNNIFIQNPNKKAADDMTNSLAVIDMIEHELADSDCDYSLANFTYTPEKYLFDIEFRNDSHPLDLLGNDPWKSGNKFIFNSLNFKYMPFFERLVCTNGMHRNQFGFHSDISKKSFTNSRLEKTIAGALHQVNDSHYLLLEEYAQRLRNTNISLDEFYGVKRWFNRGDRKVEYEALQNKYFDETPFYNSYGLPVSEQPKTWLRTADSGINAYDFVNLLTWVASHPKDSGLNTEDATDIKIMAGNIFFKENFDLMQLAPKKSVAYPKFEYPVIAEMK